MGGVGLDDLPGHFIDHAAMGLVSGGNPFAVTLEQAITAGDTATTLAKFTGGIEVDGSPLSQAHIHSTRASAANGKMLIESDTPAGSPTAQAAFDFHTTSNADYHTIWTEDLSAATLLRLDAAGVLTFGDDVDDEYIHEKQATETTASWTPQSGTWDFSAATVVGVNDTVWTGASPPTAGRYRLWINPSGGPLNTGSLQIDWAGAGTWTETGIEL